MEMIKNRELTKSIILKLSIFLFFAVSLIPLSFLPFKINGTPFHYIFVGTIVFSLVVLSWHNERAITVFDKWLVLVILAFSLSLITSVDKINTIRTIGSFILRGLGIAFVFERLSRKDYDIIPISLLICVSVVSCLGIVEYFFHWNLYSRLVSLPELFSQSIRPGITSTIGHPLILSSYLLLMLPVSIWAVRKPKITLKILSLLLVIFAIFVSFSRSSFVLSLILIILYLSLEPEIGLNNKLKLTALLVIMVFVLSFISISSKSFFAGRAAITKMKADLFYSHRAASYKTTITILKKYPLFGVGFGNYPLVHNIYRAQGTEEYFKSTDNVYLRFLCEIGLVGTAIFILFTTHWFLVFWNNRKNDFVYPLLFGLCFFMLNQFFADLFYWLTPQFTFWMLFGIAAGRSYNPLPDSSPGRSFQNIPAKYHHDIDESDFKKQTTYGQIINLIQANSTVLDIGCSTGFLGKYLIKNKQCTLYGIEIDKESAKIAEDTYTKVFAENLEKTVIFDESANRFDYIVLGDVLEHLKNPKDVLLNLRKSLKPASSVIISMPNIAVWRVRIGLLFGNFNYTAAGTLDKTHLRFFTLKSARQMINDCGYKIDYFGCAGTRMPVFLRNFLPTLLASQFVFRITPVDQ